MTRSDDDDGGTEGGDLPHRLFAVGGFVGLKTPGLDELGQPAARGGIVLDDQHAFADERLRYRFRQSLSCSRKSFLHFLAYQLH